jgi:uncharacterized protein RhaS with RHS repeats
VETGLYYNRFRYYDPHTGSYISQDPIGLGGGILNFYGYVHDPNSWVDVLGLAGDGCGLTGNNWKFDASKDLDLRNTGKTYQDALDEAFRRTGVPKEQFTPTKWERTADGKTIPTEYVGPNGANVNMDIPEWNNVKPNGALGEGTHQPHIGYQTPGKGATRTRGHIFIDNVPATRR